MKTRDVAEAERLLREKMRAINETFIAHRDELNDLKPECWYQIGFLFGTSLRENSPAELLSVLRTARPHLGAPGDFGYGTPCGDALRALYDAANDLGQAIRSQRGPNRETMD